VSNIVRSLVVTIVLLLAADRVAAQSVEPVREGGLYLTIFRNPSTGIEWRGERYGVHAGFYPTILEADGQTEGENTNFIRIGASAYLRSSGLTPYVAPSLLLSLDDDWEHGMLWDVGYRVPFGGRAAFRLGVGVLTAFDGEVRVNPTVGFDVRFGRAR
jgi:hypothetical protein